MKTIIKSLLLKLDYQLQRVEPDIVDFLISRKIDTVLDVGANAGQFGSALRKRGFRGEIVSFEPIKATFAELQAIADADGNWRALNIGLGATGSTATINVSQDTRFSSILQQTPDAERFDATAAVVRTETVQIERLDDIFDQFRGRHVFLKIDTQGFERAVLEGASTSLQHVLGILVELPIQHFYRDVWSLQDALGYLEQNAFVLAQVRPTNYDSNDPPSMVELDCVFRRKD